MRSWNLSEGDPFTLTLSADTRLSQADYFDDQIWELRMKGGEPPALTLQSSLGLRARWVRLFPRFIRRNAVIMDPATFHQAPRIQSFYPNYLSVSFYPIAGLEVVCEYWLPSSRIAAGRISLRNRGNLSEPLKMEWVGLLNPMGEGEGMSVVTSEGQTYLKGWCGNLKAVCALSGHPRTGSGAGPALALNLDLPPGAHREYLWAFATHHEEKGAFNLARETLNRRWDAEIAHLELLNASQMVEFNTHSEAWDAALAFSQKTAFSLFYSGNQNLPHPSFVLSRQPDHGFSLRGDGSDYPILWKGQTALDAYYLATLILPGGIDLMKGVLRNFLYGQEVTGQINWRPSLAGGRSSRLAQPLLAALAWEIFEVEGDPTWIVEVYPALLNFIRIWFDRDHDRDGDGFPEWEHPLQTGLEDIPLYDRWHTHAPGVDITVLECPSLGAFLYQELRCLVNMAQTLNQPEALPWLEERMAVLRHALLASQDKTSSRFHYRDAQTHQTTPGHPINTFEGTGKFPCRKHFTSPQRLQLEYRPSSQTTRPITVRVSGHSAQGDTSEDFQARNWHWSSGKASATSQTVFTALRTVEINGVAAEDSVSLGTIDYTQEDISIFLPLWAGIPTSEQSSSTIKAALLSAYAMPYGLPTCLLEQCPDEVPHLNAVSPLWNSFVIEGLLKFGYRDLAADLFSRLMDAQVLSLQSQNAFHEVYNAQTGMPGGERNHLRGLAPVGLLLKVIGIQKISKNLVILEDFCPYPWPITVKYHGVEIQSHPTHAVVTFPNGQSACLVGPGPHQISLLPTPTDEAPDTDAHLQVP